MAPSALSTRMRPKKFTGSVAERLTVAKSAGKSPSCARCSHGVDWSWGPSPVGALAGGGGV